MSDLIGALSILLLGCLLVIVWWAIDTVLAIRERVIAARHRRAALVWSARRRRYR